MENREEVEVERKTAKGKSEKTKPISLDSCFYRNDRAGAAVRDRRDKGEVRRQEVR